MWLVIWWRCRLRWNSWWTSWRQLTAKRKVQKLVGLGVVQSFMLILGRVVKSLLSAHLTSNNLVNPHQSAYCKDHSTETALLYIHDHLINATGSRIISCLCLLDLSAAFDTIDHNIFVTPPTAKSWLSVVRCVCVTTECILCKMFYYK